MARGLTPEQRAELTAAYETARSELGTKRAVADALGVSERMAYKIARGEAGNLYLPALQAIGQSRYSDAVAEAEVARTSRAGSKVPVIRDRLGFDTQVHVPAGRGSDVIRDQLLGRSDSEHVMIRFEYRDSAGRKHSGTLYRGDKGPAGARLGAIRRDLDDLGLDGFVIEEAEGHGYLDVASVSSATVVFLG